MGLQWHHTSLTGSRRGNVVLYIQSCVISVTLRFPVTLNLLSVSPEIHLHHTVLSQCLWRVFKMRQLSQQLCTAYVRQKQRLNSGHSLNSHIMYCEYFRENDCEILRVLHSLTVRLECLYSGPEPNLSCQVRCEAEQQLIWNINSLVLWDGAAILNQQFSNSYQARIDILSISCEVILTWMPQDLTDD